LKFRTAKPRAARRVFSARATAQLGGFVSGTLAVLWPEPDARVFLEAFAIGLGSFLVR